MTARAEDIVYTRVVNEATYYNITTYVRTYVTYVRTLRRTFVTSYVRYWFAHNPYCITYCECCDLKARVLATVNSLFLDAEPITAISNVKTPRSEDQVSKPVLGYITRSTPPCYNISPGNGAPIRGLRFIMPPPSDNRGFNQVNFTSLSPLYNPILPLSLGK